MIELISSRYKSPDGKHSVQIKRKFSLLDRLNLDIHDILFAEIRDDSSTFSGIFSQLVPKRVNFGECHFIGMPSLSGETLSTDILRDISLCAKNDYFDINMI